MIRDQMVDVYWSKKRRISQYTGFAEVKADYQKNNADQTHSNLLRLALFASNGYDEYNTVCILVLQAIGKVTKQLASRFELTYFCPKSRIKHNGIWLYSTCEWCQCHVWANESSMPRLASRFAPVLYAVEQAKNASAILRWLLFKNYKQKSQKEIFRTCWSGFRQNLEYSPTKASEAVRWLLICYHFVRHPSPLYFILYTMYVTYSHII